MVDLVVAPTGDGVLHLRDACRKTEKKIEKERPLMPRTILSDAPNHLPPNLPRVFFSTTRRTYSIQYE